MGKAVLYRYALSTKAYRATDAERHKKLLREFRRDDTDYSTTRHSPSDVVHHPNPTREFPHLERRRQRRRSARVAGGGEGRVDDLHLSVR